jgi:hypothetical protein
MFQHLKTSQMPLRFSCKLETFASQFASDEMSETSDYNKREKLCQAKVEISQISTSIKNHFASDKNHFASEPFLIRRQHNYHALARLNSEL